MGAVRLDFGGMKSSSVLFLAACGAVALVVSAGCGGGGKKKEVTELQRKESAHHASDAQFAMSVRDYARAEASLAKATALTPDDGALWVSLGAARVKLGNKAGAKAAYQAALSAYEKAARSEKKDPEAWTSQAYVLALLGRAEEGRAVIQKAAKQFPENRSLKALVESKQFDRMLADAAFKERAL